MPKKREPRVVSPEKVAKAAGFFLVLLGLLVAFSPVSRLWGIAFLAFLPFGLASYLFAIASLIAQGVVLFLRPRFKWRIPLRFWLGSICLMVALSLMFPLIFNEPDIGQFAPFFEHFFIAGNERYGFFLHPEIFGGVLGFVLDGVMVPWTKFAIVLPVLIAVFFLAFLLFFLPPIVRGFRNLRARRTIAKSRREQIAADEEKHRASLGKPFNNLEGSALPEAGDRPSMEHERPIPVFRYERKIERETEEIEEKGEERPEEEPTRMSRRVVRASTAPYSIQPGKGEEMEKAMPHVVAPGLPRDLPSPDPSEYRHNPIQHTGLQPAYMMLEEEEPSPSVPDPRPSEASPAERSEEGAEARANESASPFPGPTREEPSSARLASPFPGEEAILREESEEEPLDFLPDLNVEPIVLATAAPKEEPLPPAAETAVAPSPSPFPAPKMPAQAAPSPAEEKKPLPTPKKNEAKKEAPLAEPQLPPYLLPDLSLIDPPSEEDGDVREALEAETQATAAEIDAFFEEFGVGAKVANITVGPSITVYEISPDSGVSIAKIRNVINDLDVRLNGITSRFTDRVYGTKNCSIEVPNQTRRMVSFHEVMDQIGNKYALMIPFGIDVHGKLIQASLRKFVHMLVCGMTGSGKSVFMHAMICALIMRHSPEEVRFLLVDPKRVEFRKYCDIPHLLCPIVTEPKKAVVALDRLCDEMDARYDVFYDANVRDIESYNRSYAPAHNLPKMPFIVTVVDEYADLTQECKDVHASIARLAAKARSCGIHLIIATQRPSVDVISGTIKSNLSTRVALRVKKDVDSITILNEKGAEGLLGNGDLLVDCGEVSTSGFVRCQGCYIKDEEIDRICQDATSKRGQDFSARFLNLDPAPEVETPSEANAAAAKEASNDDKYEMVKRFVMTRETTSISSIQREFNIGYPRSSEFFRRLKEEGIIGDSGATNSAKGTPVLVHSLPEDEEGGVLDVPSLH